MKTASAIVVIAGVGLMGGTLACMPETAPESGRFATDPVGRQTTLDESPRVLPEPEVLDGGAGASNAPDNAAGARSTRARADQLDRLDIPEEQRPGYLQRPEGNTRLSPRVRTGDSTSDPIESQRPIDAQPGSPPPPNPTTIQREGGTNNRQSPARNSGSSR